VMANILHVSYLLPKPIKITGLVFHVISRTNSISRRHMLSMTARAQQKRRSFLPRWGSKAAARFVGSLQSL